MMRPSPRRNRKRGARCPHCHLLPVEAWVARLNRLADEMDEECATAHPSSWHETLAAEREKYQQLARQPTCSCPVERK